MTDEERDQVARDNCPYCRAGRPVRQRADTGEFVHDIANGVAMKSVICLSNGLRGGPHLANV